MVPGLSMESEMKERITDELEHLRSLLAVAHPKDQSALFIAQQTLTWALDPSLAAAPRDLIEGSLQEHEGYYRTAHLELSEHAHG